MSETKKEVNKCEGVFCKHAERNCEYWIALKEQNNKETPTLRNPIRSYHYY